MLRWRLTLGPIIAAVLIGLIWLDAHIAFDDKMVGGLILVPIGLVCMMMATHEILDLLEASGMRPRRKVVYFGNILIMACSWGACLWCYVWGPEAEIAARSWEWSTTACVGTLLALSAGVLMAFYAEMRWFVKPGGVTINLAGAVFAMSYVGMMTGFLVQLRMAWGVMALTSLIVVVKMADIGAYTIGRLFGRNKMAPDLSPGKTIEGAMGGLLFACIGAWISLSIIPGFSPTLIGIISYGVIVGIAGMTGDLAESLIKRDAKQKDSSRWMPGFGGVLDIMDSILLAAPFAYAWWLFGLVGSIIEK